MKKLFTLLFAVMASISTTFAFTANDEIPTPEPCSTISGTCGKNLSWELTCDGVLTISGTGAMKDWNNASDVPWYQYRSQITHVNLPNELTSIGNRAFFMCSKLTSIVLPNTVTKIGSYAFSACSKLAAITLSNSLTSIGSSAFGGCSSMETIELPSTLTTIGKMAFESCQWSSFTCKAILPPECKDEVFLYVDPNIPLYVPAESVDAYKAADGWKDFTNILPIGGEDPFIPVGTDISVAKAISIGQELEIGAKTTIEYTITGYVSAITDGYDEKNGIQSFWIADENVLANSNEAGALYIYRGKVSKAIAFGNKVSVKAYISNYKGLIETYQNAVVTILNEEERVPDLISGICGEEGDGTNLTWQLNTKTGTLEIKGAGKMASLVEKIAGAPENLGWHYFRPYIRKVILPAELTKIGNHAFYQCENLESVVIPDKVDSIGKYAFTGCVKLTQINMPESVRALGANAFYGTSVTDPVYNSKIFGYMPKSYEGKYVVPEGIVSIATRSFVNCGKLTEIIMPESLKRLGTDVFDGCGALQSLTCYAVNPPECVHTFTGIDKTIPVYVPAESVEAYRNADGWSEFSNILPIGGEDPFIPIGTDTYTCKVTPSEYSAEFEWSVISDVDSYQLILKDKEDQTKCILNLNSEGKLIDIAFYAPSHNRVPRKNETSNLSYIVTGLESGTTYYYTLTAKDDKNGIIKTFEGSFSTLGATPEPCSTLSGSCGDNLTWELSCDSVLTVSGSGSMWRLTEEQAWRPNKERIKTVILPEGLDSISPNAFYQCINLTSVNMPNNVRAVGHKAFVGCDKLTEPVYNERIFAFLPARYGDTYSVPEGIVSIAAYANSIVPPTEESVAIGVSEIVLPSTLKRLGMYSLGRLLKKITCYATTPPVCNTGVFDYYLEDVGVTLTIDKTIPVYVPAESVDAYKAADGWKEFENILPIEVTPEPNKYIITFLNDDGTKLDQREWEEGETPTCQEPTKEDDDYIYCFKGWNPKIVPVTETATYQAEYDVCGGWLAGNIQWRIYKDTLIVSGNGVIPDYEQGGAPWLPFNSRINAIRVAKGITRIGEWAFADMTPIRVQIAQSVIVMGANAFKGSSTIDKVVFDGYDYEWAEINFVNEYSNPLYYGASFNYQVLHINATTKTISTGAFVGFSTVVYHGTLEQWCSMTFTSDYHPSYDLQFDDVVITEICPGEGMTKISAHAFHGCRSIERVCLPISLKQIGQDAFKNMPNLKTVTYAGDLKQWSAITFANSEANPACHADLYFGDNKLGTRLDIPDSVTVINPFVFPNTKTLNVYFHHMDPAGYELNSFGEPDQVGDKHFYVPCGTKDAYQKRLNYSEELFEEYFHYNYEVVSADEQKGKVSILHVPTCDEPQLEILATPNQGFRFVEWSDGSTEAQRSLTLESDTVLEASFDLDSVMIRFLLDDSTLVLEKMFKYGTLPECADPVKDPTAQYTFTFLHWKPEIKVALKDTTYIAVFDSVVNAYMVYFINWNGVLLAEQEVEYGSAAVAPEVPAPENYQFVGWNVDINSIVGRTFAVAQFEKEESQGEYTIHYHNTVDDTEIAGETIDLHFPEPPEIEGFVFVGWQAVCDEFIVEGMVIQAVYEPLVPQSAEQVVVNPSNPAQKLFRNGTVYVLQDEKVYTVTGQTVK